MDRAPSNQLDVGALQRLFFPHKNQRARCNLLHSFCGAGPFSRPTSGCAFKVAPTSVSGSSETRKVSERSVKGLNGLAHLFVFAWRLSKRAINENQSNYSRQQNFDHLFLNFSVGSLTPHFS
jgi:hypothetical protein